jgi:short-subunit dehydrogenase
MATARIYAAEGASILLVGRAMGRLEQTSADLKSRGAGRVEIAICDLATPDDAPGQLQGFVDQIGGVDHIILAYGILGDQHAAERDIEHAEEILRVNLVVIGSVAGDRGRRANYIYGASKSGLAILVQGIAHRFANKGPRAVLVKPGPTITPMTEGMNRSGLLWARPEQIAAVVHAAALRGGPVAYAPGFWRYIMLVIRNIPSRIFNRMEI